MVAEGVYAARSVREFAQAHSLDMPRFEHIYRVLHEGLPVSQALATLLDLPTGRDVPRSLHRAQLHTREAT